ncbi:MAG: SpoIIE family protein phosphatase [Candidatus Eremiobacteraeota bacterium]|nr:SpoIIE family protein phosphatase [Candidatus Eremiobacteraeota bacterium]
MLRQGDCWLLAVADSHLGQYAGHQLLTEMSLRWSCVPSHLGQLSLMLSAFEWPTEPSGGGTTLLVAVLNRASGEVFGLSYGDSSLLTVSRDAVVLRNRVNDQFLAQGVPLRIEQAEVFRFVLARDESLLLYTDGVNECCYRDPHRSIQARHLLEVFQRSDGGGRLLALTELALSGVEGQPGGQDNIAAILVGPLESD